MQKPNSNTFLTNSRYVQLDSLRGLAALVVFFWHFNKNISINSEFPFSVFWNGRAAVMFFFLLSGFVLSLPFVKSEKPLFITEFYVKRVLRIYPTFVVTIVICLLTKYLLFDNLLIKPNPEWLIPKFWVWKWDAMHVKEIAKTFCLIGVKIDDNLTDPVIWSLSVEMSISLILPLFLILVRQNNILFNVVFLLFFMYASRANNLLIYLFPFHLGVVLAKYKTEIINFINRVNIIVLILFIVLAVMLYTSNLTLRKEGLLTDDAISIGGSMFMMLVLAKAKLSAFLSNRVFQFFGDISYSFYLIHMPVQFVVCSLFYTMNNVNYFFIIPISLVVCIGVSYLIHIIFEKQFMKLSKNVSAKVKFLKTLNLAN